MQICRVSSVFRRLPSYQSITEAISHFPKPANRTDLHSFFGLVNQLSSSVSTIATLLTPLRPLLSTKNEFLWNKDHEEAFTAAKKALTTTPILSFFDASKATRLCPDASREGLGFVLQQQDSNGTWSLIQAGSRFLIETESHYAVIVGDVGSMLGRTEMQTLFNRIATFLYHHGPQPLGPNH